MNVRLGLQRVVAEWRRRERYEIEQELYDDLRDADGMIDLTAYGDLVARHREAVNYLDLSPAALDAAHAEALAHGSVDAEDWSAA